MRIVKVILGLAAASLVLATPASAEDDSNLCGIYGSVGGSMTEFMLPLTMQQFIDMMNGKEPELLQRMTMALLGDVSGAELMALSTLPPEEGEIIGEAAGQVAVELLMSGQASSKDEVKSILTSTCNTVGARNIIANQRKARAATNANMGK